jgi:Protein of unknown function (DUF3522)
MAEPNVLMIISNVAFIIPSIKSVALNRWTRAALYFCMIFASSFYHAYFGVSVARKTDFFFAQLLIPVTALYIVQFGRKLYFLERWLIIAFAVALFLVEVFLNEPLWMQLVVVGVSAFVVLVYWGWHAWQRGGLPKYDWDNFALGIALSATACTLYVTQTEWHLGRAYIHSLWHVLAALGQYFILCIRPEGERYASLDAPLRMSKMVERV